MIDVTFEELLEKQSAGDWVIGVPESEAQYVVRQVVPEAGEHIYARDTTPEEKSKVFDVSLWEIK